MTTLTIGRYNPSNCDRNPMLRPRYHQTSRRHRGGFTLLEVLLVLTLLIVISAVIWPSLGRMFSRQNMERAQSDVQVLLAAARIRATEAGASYQFRYEVGGRRYVLVPADGAELVAVADTPGTDLATAASEAWKRSGELPESVTFQLPAGLSTDAGGEPISAELLTGLLDTDALSRVAWGPAILFHPDGTASDSIFLIVDDVNDESTTITVRGLTGASHATATLVEEQ
ncbi:hypothetical protein Mal52_39050 [Symmachiella dynata]|uniref:General secretion pathway GspH domain-containing protein n=2 Tax=Symmachiella dynata TaxID=2527995 RepID=A0A517ZSD3_9PLAN|nr:hypothetical protein Mal52_39050 [Symmachiella dynata]